MAKRRIEELQRPHEINQIKEYFMEFMQFMFTRSQENIVKSMPWGDNRKPSKGRQPSMIADTGNLLRSSIPPIWDGNKIRFSYDAPYAMAIEFGRPVGSMPPVQPIQKWARRKLRLSKPAADKAGWAIAMQMKEEGVPPHPFLRPAIAEAVSKYKMKFKPPQF